MYIIFYQIILYNQRERVITMFENVDINTLSDIDRSLIKYILNNLEIASLMRVRDLADAVHVSPSTVMRFLDHVEYDSFAALKVDIKQKLIDTKSLIDSKNLAKVNYTEHLNFDDDFESKIEELADRISEANITYLMGLGSSGIMADYCSRLLISIGYRCHVSKDGYLPILWNEQIFDHSNVILLFSTSGETKELMNVTKNLGDKRAFIASITNNNHNTIAVQSNLNIPYYITKDRLSFHVDLTSQMSVVYIIEALVRILHQRRIQSDKTPFQD